MKIIKILQVVATHLPPQQVRHHLEYLEFITPGIPRLVAYGGPFEHFQQLGIENAIFLENPLLRGPMVYQCFNELPGKTVRYMEERNLSCDLIHVTEYDHIILSRSYFHDLAEIFEKSKCDYLGQGGNLKTNSNWPFYLRHRDDEEFLDYLSQISIREDKTAMYGVLLNGYVLTTQIFHAIAALPQLPIVFGELLFPTIAHHLGYKIGDLDTYSDLFRYNRYRPIWNKAEVMQMVSNGEIAVHPFKDYGALDDLRKLIGARAPAG